MNVKIVTIHEVGLSILRPLGDMHANGAARVADRQPFSLIQPFVLLFAVSAVRFSAARFRCNLCMVPFKDVEDLHESVRPPTGT